MIATIDIVNNQRTPTPVLSLFGPHLICHDRYSQTIFLYYVMSAK